MAVETHCCRQTGVANSTLILAIQAHHAAIATPLSASAPAELMVD